MRCDCFHAIGCMIPIDLRPLAVRSIEWEASLLSCGRRLAHTGRRSRSHQKRKESVAIRIFQHYWQLPRAILALVEAIVFFLAPYAAVWVPGAPDEIGPLLPRALLFAGVLFVSMAAMGLYTSRQRSRLAGMLARVAASVIGGMMVVAIVFYVVPSLHIGRGTLLLTGVFAFAGAVIVRAVFDTVVDDDLFRRRVLVYGAGRRAGSICRLRRRSDRRGFMIIGYVPADGDEAGVVPEAEKLAPSTDLALLCAARRVDEIVVAMDDRRRRFPMDQLLECRLEGVEILDRKSVA